MCLSVSEVYVDITESPVLKGILIEEGQSMTKWETEGNMDHQAALKYLTWLT